MIPSSSRRARAVTNTRATARPLPLPTLPNGRHGTDGVVYGMATVDRSGRICDRAITAALRWARGDVLSVAVKDQVLEIWRDHAGLVTIAARGYIPIPASARRRVAIQPTDRVLLAATPHADSLLVYPISAVHQSLQAFLTRGDAA